MMKKTCYKVPFDFQSIVTGDADTMPMCSELESIDDYLELLITTCPGEHKFNKNFGCRIWDMDFEMVVSRKEWLDEFKGHILSAIQRNESRLKDVTVSIDIMEVTREDHVMQTTAIKKKVMVYINGSAVSTNIPCGFHYALFLGPLSTE